MVRLTRAAPADGAAESQVPHALEGAITVIRKIWSGERNLRFDGDHYHLAGAQSGPDPTRPIGIWFGVYGPRALALAGRVADGWVPSFQRDLDKITQMSARLDEAVAEAGRASGEVRRVLNISGTITDEASHGHFEGPVDQWADEIAALATDLRFDTFIFWGEGDDQLERFAEQVVPAARGQLTASA